MRYRRPTLFLFGAAFVAVLFATSSETSTALQPVSMTSADLNGDGLADVIVGCPDGKAGLLGIRLRAAGPVSEAPFAPEVARLKVSESPDFLAAGDYDLDGRQDLLVAALRSRALWIYHGDGRGGFDDVRKIVLEGQLSALAAGEVNRADGIDDVVAAVQTDDGAKLLVFDFHRGAFASAPESIEIKEAAASLVLGRFDDDIFVDMAAAVGREIRLIHGRDRKTSLPGPETVVQEIEVETVTLDDLAARTDDDIVRRLEGPQMDLVVPSVPCGEVSVARAPSALTFVVDTTGNADDSVPGNGLCADATGFCSLRAAIQEANASAGADTINFNLGSGTPTIYPGVSVFPTITEAVTIDGATGGATRVELNGVTAASGASGLVVGPGAGAVAIRNLVINGFGAAGIHLENANGVVEGCYVGTDAAGGATVAGNGRGIEISGASATNNTIGGTTAAQRNVISHNTSYGILVASSASGTKIQGSYIGTDASGAAANANGPTGIFLDNATTTLIGGAAPGPGLPPGNLISGGVSVGPQSAGTLIQGNLIGTDATGATTIPGAPAATVSSSAANVTIGGSAASLRNVIAGSISISSTTSGGSLVQGNYVGTEISGMSALTGGNVTINLSASATVGGNAATPGAPPGNVLRTGVSITGDFNSSSGTLRGNLIGLRADGNAALAGATGVTLGGGSHAFALATIGGDTPGDGNVISGATGAGISLTNAVATVKGNFIGLNIDGTAVIGNSGDGISVTSFSPGADVSTLTLGGTTPAARNVIAGNGGHGVSLARNITGSVIEGNAIGVLANGTTAAGNGGHGVRASGISGALNVGGTTGLTPGACTGSCNVIANNAGDGFAMINDSGFGSAAIRGNSCFGNLGLGIDLNDNGPDTNDPGDADNGVNGFQNYPLVTSEIYDGVNTTIQGSLNSTANSSFAIDVFSNTEADSSGFVEGRTYVGSTTCATNASGNCSWTVVYNGHSSLHTATATTTSGKTSELTKVQNPNDLDGDGLQNGVDNCPNNYNPLQEDADGDGRGDLCDNCVSVANANQANADGDAQGDSCDACPMDAANDQDGDGACANVDNCPTTWNRTQSDRDSDGRGDRCDACPSVPDPIDSDGDGAGDACDCEPNDYTDRPPGDIQGLAAAKNGTSGVTLSWLGGLGFDRCAISRGLLSTKGPGQYGSCLVQGADFIYTDSAIPPVGDGFFYLVQGQNFECGMGLLGFTGTDADRVNSNPNACHGLPFTDAFASSETTVMGTRTAGSYLDTHSNNDVVESLTEAIVGPASRLDHRWTFSVPPGTSIELHVEGYHAASTDGDIFFIEVGGTPYGFPFPAADNDRDFTIDLGGGLSGTVVVRIRDSGTTSGTTLDTFHMDQLWLRSIP